MRIAPVLIFLLALLCALSRADELPIFPSRDTLHPLTNTEGETIRAVINDVSASERTVRVLVPDQAATFTLSLDTFDRDSQALIEDWYFKNLASRSLSLEVTEQLLGSRGRGAASGEGLPRAPASALNVRISDQTRDKDIAVELRNSSRYPIEHLRVTIMLYVTRETSSSNTSGKSYFERGVRTVHRDIALGAGASLTLRSAPVPLTNYTLRYDLLLVGAAADGGLEDRMVRHRIQSSDRISTYYVLVHYKGELVAANIRHRYLINEIIEQEQPAQTTQPPENIEVTESPFAPGRSRGRNALEDVLEPR